MPVVLTRLAISDPTRGLALTWLTAPNSLRNHYELTRNHSELSQIGRGYIKRDVTWLVKPGRNTLALHIENYAGAAWQGQLLRFDKSQMLLDYPHRRFNQLTREWVLVSPQRAKRPWLGQVENTRCSSPHPSLASVASCVSRRVTS